MFTDLAQSLENSGNVTVTNYVSKIVNRSQVVDFKQTFYKMLNRFPGEASILSNHFPKIYIYSWIDYCKSSPITDYLVTHNNDGEMNYPKFNKIRNHLTANKYSVDYLKAALFPFKELINGSSYPQFGVTAQHTVLEILKSNDLVEQWEQFRDFLPMIKDDEPIITTKKTHLEIIILSHSALLHYHNYALSKHEMENAIKALQLMQGDNFPLLDRFQILKTLENSSEILVESNTPISQSTIETHIQHIINYYITNNFQVHNYSTYPGKESVDAEMIPYLKKYSQYLTLQKNLSNKNQATKTCKI